MFVFGEVQDPVQETVNLVEDIVRSQIIELVCLYFMSRVMHSEVADADPSSTSACDPPRCSLLVLRRPHLPH